LLVQTACGGGDVAAAAGPGGLSAVAELVLAETAGQVYRLQHGLERCCSLDTPSCVLTGLVVYDRLCRRRDDGAPRTVGDHVGDPQPRPSLTDGRQTDPALSFNGSPCKYVNNWMQY